MLRNQATTAPGRRGQRARQVLVALLLAMCAPIPASADIGPVLAHRGVSQPYDRVGLTHQTCTARHLLPATHRWLENTLASMQAAFDAGADVVEIDVQRTADVRFAVFHDWTLDCRTDGQGRTRDMTMADLKRLDIGHGYTADGGRTFPFRGQGVGAMPELDEVFAALPGRRWLLDIKGNDPAEGEALADRLNALPPAQRERVAVYGGDAPVAVVRARVPDVRVSSRALLKRCLLTDLLIGWTGRVPTACERLLVLVPISHANWLWGWPDRLAERFARADSEVYLVGPLTDGPMGWIDTRADLARVPPGYRGGVFTDRLLDLAAALQQRRGAAPR